MAILVAALAIAAPFEVTLVAPTHTPKANARWYYSVRAVDAKGRAVHGRITVEIVDPFGGAHPVQFGTSTKNITNFRFGGRFRDFVEWPTESRGFKLTLRVSVRSGGKVVRKTYWVKPR
jgi:hypothetical protein